MPSALFCFHSYGQWSKLRKGKKSRTCKKCRKRQTKNASSWDQMFCWHHFQGGKSGKLKIPTCVKCGKTKQIKKLAPQKP